jgi:hypothetical protein
MTTTSCLDELGLLIEQVNNKITNNTIDNKTMLSITSALRTTRTSITNEQPIVTLVGTSTSLGKILDDKGRIVWQVDRTVAGKMFGSKKVGEFWNNSFGTPTRFCLIWMYTLTLLTLACLAFFNVVPDVVGGIVNGFMLIGNVTLPLSLFDTKIARHIIMTPAFLARTILSVLFAITLVIIAGNDGNGGTRSTIIGSSVNVVFLVGGEGMIDSAPRISRVFGIPATLMDLSVVIGILVTINVGYFPFQLDPSSESARLSFGKFGISRFDIQTNVYGLFNEAGTSLALFLVSEMIERYRRREQGELIGISMSLVGVDGDNTPELPMLQVLSRVFCVGSATKGTTITNAVVYQQQ